MPEIQIEKNPSAERLKDLGVTNWPIWTKEASEFPWSYGERERCYFLEGDGQLWERQALCRARIVYASPPMAETGTAVRLAKLRLSANVR